MEQAVSAEFAVSRGPVREALRLLESDGLVTILPRRGAQVTTLSTEEVREIFDIRASLNGLRDRQIAESPERDRVLPMLEEEVEQLARLARDPKRGGRIRRDRIPPEPSAQRRRAQPAAARDPVVARAADAALFAPGTVDTRAPAPVGGNWQRLVKAVREGDGLEAQRAAEQRVLDSRDAAIAELEKRDDEA